MGGLAKTIWSGAKLAYNESTVVAIPGPNMINMNVAAEGMYAYRYVTEGEVKAIEKTGMLRGGNPGETFFTKDLYKSGASAQSRLSLPNTPTHRVEFQLTENVNLLRNGSKVDPAFNQVGKGAEFMTTEPVKVRIINVQKLK